MNSMLLSAVPPQAWRNGGGTTQELLAWPQHDAWALRLSVARIDRSGPFSAFPGVLRSFAVLQGRGVRLRWPLGDKLVKQGDAALDFDGGDPPDCTLIDGPTTDLNLMVQASAGRGSLSRAQLGQAWRSTAPWRGVYTTEAARLQRNTAAPDLVPAHSLTWCTDASLEDWTLEAAGAGSAWWIEFQPQNLSTPTRSTA
jgi:uncharacterized protein